MGEILEFLFENIYILIIIISAIIGFFSGDKKEQKQKEKPKPVRPVRPKPVLSRTETRNATTSRERTIDRTNKQEVLTTKLEPKETTTSTTKMSDAIEMEQQAQFERLQERLGTVQSSEVQYDNFITDQDLTTSKALQKSNDYSEEQKVLKNNLRSSLRNKGLINGIIMAEVLGKPRALKPYQSVIVERYKK